MSTPAQVLANQANAQLSTGPKTAEGKAKSARNNTSHGLAGRAFFLPESLREEFHQFEADLQEELEPENELQTQAFHMMRDALWRIRTIRRLIVELQQRHDGADPLTHPETAAEVKQLTRYRASAEMLLYRSLKLICELKTCAYVRNRYLTEKENAAFPPLAENKVVRRWAGRIRYFPIPNPISPPVCISPPGLLS